MAYEFNHYYELQNVATGKYVNVLGNHEDGTVKNGVWSSHKARQGLWHKCGSIIMIFVSVLTDILLGLTLNHISGLTLPFSYDMLLTPIVLFWYIVSELGSILENAEKMGAPIPPLLKNILEKMRDSNDDKNTPSL